MVGTVTTLLNDDDDKAGPVYVYYEQMMYHGLSKKLALDSWHCIYMMTMIKSAQGGLLEMPFRVVQIHCASSGILECKEMFQMLLRSFKRVKNHTVWRLE